MLWFDNSKSDLKTKIERAVNYYQMKYGRIPTLCFVHPSMLEDVRISGIDVKGNRQVLPNHLWVGVKQ
jgi:hypothetical protein